jgi:glutaredoxin
MSYRKLLGGEMVLTNLAESGMKYLSMVSAVLFLLASPSAAELYKWTDSDGVVTFKDTPPPQKKKQKRIKVKVYSDVDFSPAPPPRAAAPSSAQKAGGGEERPSVRPRFSGTIEMYVTEWCPVCREAEKYIAGKNYSYVKYDIDKDKSARQRFTGLGGRGVPLIMIGSKKMSGFSAQQLEKYIDDQQQ